MNWSRIWPWGSPRAKLAPLRRKPSVARLAIERLEERLVPSTTADDAAYQAWRQQQYAVDDLAVVDSLVGPSQISTIDSQATNNSFGSLIGLPSVFNTPYRGTGYSVVVIDTGIDYRHADLGGGFGAGKRVIAGWDFVNKDADPLDDNGHGTHVAGIIGSSSATYSGVAPNVNLIALKVLDKNGSGTFGAVEDALKWVVANQSKYNIVSINLSLGAGNYTTNPYTFLDDEFTSLRNQGVFLAVAAGNSFYSYNSQIGLDFPAVNPHVVSVGAVWSGNFGAVAWGSGARDNTTAADRVASFTQRGPGLSIMAPGAISNSTYLNNTYKTMAGTSMASPVVAAAAAILHQAMDARNLTANQDTILSLMRSTADNVVDGDDENDNVVNTGLTFKRLDLGAALGAVGTPANSAPVLQAIGPKSVASGKTTVVTLAATDTDNDSITYSAQVLGATATQAYELKQQLNLQYADTYYLNAWGQNEKWMIGANGICYCILPNGEFRRWTGSMASTMQADQLVATFDASYYANPTLLLDAQASSGIAPTVSVAGNQLTIHAPAGASGSFQVRVTASDGKASSQRTFSLSVTNSMPMLQPIANQAIAPGKAQTITLNVSDSDNVPLTYSATVVSSLAAQAYQLKQQYSLGFSGNYYQNAWGQNEKWFSTPKGFFFCILPNGELRRWTGSMNTTLQAANLVGTLDPIAYDDPSLIWNAQSAGAAAPVISFAGNQMTIQAPTGGLNSFQIRVTVSDGAASSQQLFTLTLKNNKPVLQAISNQTVNAGQSLSVNVSASDADGDVLTYSARIVSSLASQAHQFRQQFSLGYGGSYYQNAWGQNEKWFSTPKGFFFCILPNGELRRWTGKMSTTLQAGNLIGTFDAAYHADPSLLWNAKPDGAAPNLTFAGNQLSIIAPAGVMDAYQIEVSVSDGVTSTTRTFTLTVSGTGTPPPSSGLGGDFNADGRQDSAELRNDGSLWVSIANANGSVTKQLWTQWSAAIYWTSVYVIDVNGDGKDDIVGLNKNAKYYIAFSNGAAFTTQLWTSSLPPTDQ